MAAKKTVNGSGRDVYKELQGLQLQQEAAWEMLIEAQDRLRQAADEVQRIRRVIAAVANQFR